MNDFTLPPEAAAILGVFAALSESAVPLGVVAAGVAVLTAFSYYKSRAEDPGLTTEMALLATFVIGVLACRQPLLAAAAGVRVIILLVSRRPLQGFARRELSEQELRDAVLLQEKAWIPIRTRTRCWRRCAPRL
jgi:uncharacterized membrane protein (DUF4010 family)